MSRGLALTNLILQILLIATAGVAFWLARRRRLGRHCLVMRIAIGVQIILVGALMAPRLSVFLSNWSGWSRFTAEIIIHHTFGVIVVVLFIFFNLVMTGVVKYRGRLRPFMWTALVLWLASLGMGLHLYWYIWR
jgi:hypothetical protein